MGHLSSGNQSNTYGGIVSPRENAHQSVRENACVKGAVADFCRSCLPGRTSRLTATCVHVNREYRLAVSLALRTRFALRQYENPFRQKGPTLITIRDSPREDLQRDLPAKYWRSLSENFKSQISDLELISGSSGPGKNCRKELVHHGCHLNVRPKPRSSCEQKRGKLLA
jgi:hypothetical protein